MSSIHHAVSAKQLAANQANAQKSTGPGVYQCPRLGFQLPTAETSELRKRTQRAKTLVMNGMPGNGTEQTHCTYPTLYQQRAAPLAPILAKNKCGAKRSVKDSGPSREPCVENKHFRRESEARPVGSGAGTGEM